MRRRIDGDVPAVLDAQGLEAYFVGEPAMADVQGLLRSGIQVLIASVNLAEVFDRMRRVYGADLAGLYADLLEIDLHVTSVDADLALSAAELRAVHYHRRRRPVSLTDCIAAALALDRAAPLVTSDPALLELMVDEGGSIEVIPGSDGTRWSG